VASIWLYCFPIFLQWCSRLSSIISGDSAESHRLEIRLGKRSVMEQGFGLSLFVLFIMYTCT
jgi:hypothetical protein